MNYPLFMISYKKPYTLLFLFSISVISPSMLGQEKNNYFEGEVTFVINHKSLDPEYSDEYFDFIFGTGMTGIVKEDIYKTIIESEALGTLTTYYDLTNKRVYFEESRSDTIKWVPLDEYTGELISVDRNKAERKLLLGALRESVTIEYIPDDPYVEKITGTFYFNTDHKLNKELYANHKYGFWNLFINESGSISVRNETVVYPLLISIAQVTKIEEREVSRDEFKLDPNKIVVRRED